METAAQVALDAEGLQPLLETLDFEEVEGVCIVMHDLSLQVVLHCNNSF